MHLPFVQNLEAINALTSFSLMEGSSSFYLIEAFKLFVVTMFNVLQVTNVTLILLWL